MINKTVSELAQSIRSNKFPINYGQYTIESVSSEEYYIEQSKIFSKVFPSTSGYTPDLSENKKLMACSNEYKKIHSEKFLIKYKGKTVGWSQGEMEDFETFSMRSTGILPKHQGKGIYTEFLKVFESYIFKLGYARISSQHSPANATVLSLKLKNKYVVVGQEFHERWGVLIKLVKFSSKKRYDYFQKRID